jgi:hypothetical protein
MCSWTLWKLTSEHEYTQSPPTWSLIQICVSQRRGCLLRNASLGDFVVMRTCTYTNLGSIAYYALRLLLLLLLGYKRVEHVTVLNTVDNCNTMVGTTIYIILLVVRLTTDPKPLPKRALHIVRSRAFSFKWEYHLLSLRSSSRFLRLLPRLPVTFIPPFIFLQ